MICIRLLGRGQYEGIAVNFLLDPQVTFGLSIVAGLGLCLLGVKNLSEGLQGLFGSFIRRWMNRIDGNPIMSFTSGAVVSTLIPSGMTLGTMAVSYANSGLMSLRQMLLFLLGAQLGVLFLPWLFIGPRPHWDLLFLALGIFPMMLLKMEKWIAVGRILVSLGLLFLAYRLMTWISVDEAIGALMLSHFMPTLTSGLLAYWYLILTAAILSFVTRSGLSLLIVTMALLSLGLVSMQSAVIWVLGVNLGLRLPALWVCRKANVIAQRGALVHFLISCMGIGALSVSPGAFIGWVLELSQGWLETQNLGVLSQGAVVAIAHVIINLGLIGLGVVLLPVWEWVVKTLLPETETKQPQRLQFLARPLHMAPILAIEHVSQEIKKMMALTESMLRLTCEVVESPHVDKELRDKVYKYEGITDNIQKEVRVYLAEVMESQLTRGQSREIQRLLKKVDELESVADCCQKTLAAYLSMAEFSGREEIQSRLKGFLRATVLVFEQAFPIMTGLDETEDSISRRMEYMQELRHQVELLHITFNRLLSELNPQLQGEASIYLGHMVIHVGQIATHTMNLMEAHCEEF